MPTLQVKVPIVTRTLQWIVGDDIQLDPQYEVLPRSNGGEQGQEVDVLLDNAICATVDAVTSKVHVEVQAASLHKMALRMLCYGLERGDRMKVDSAVSAGSLAIVLPYQTIVVLKASKESSVDSQGIVAYTWKNDPAVVYNVRVKYLTADCEGTLLFPAYLAEARNLQIDKDKEMWYSHVAALSKQLPPAIGESYEANLIQAAIQRYKLGDDFMAAEERINEYKDLPDPTRVREDAAREEGIAKGMRQSALKLREAGMTRKQILDLLGVDVGEESRGGTELSKMHLD